LLEAILAFVFGLLIGSFLNVCIYRLPRDLSIVRPRSQCVVCRHMIAWHDNIPVLSYLLLRGRCRHCGGSIALRYPLVELLTGGLFLLYIQMLGPTLEGAKFCLLGALMLALIVTDLEQRILPDELTLGGLAAGLVLAWFVPVDDVTARALLWAFGADPGLRWGSLAEAVLGALLPALSLWLVGAIYYRLRRREGLGLGDVKLMALVGAFLGSRSALLTLICGSVLGSIVGLIYIRLTGKDSATYELPLGTFLGIAAILVSFAGQPVIAWYRGLF